jgi:diphthamide biosynthesis methyltransferase
MRKFKLAGMVTVSVYTEVEADTLEQAIEIAKQRDIEKYQWSDTEQSSDAWVNEEYDGEVHSIDEA